MVLVILEINVIVEFNLRKNYRKQLQCVYNCVRLNTGGSAFLELLFLYLY